MIASTITIGFGGSVGTEATIVLTGASIGSNMARFFHMNYKVMTLMIGCGAAGAIAGILLFTTGLSPEFSKLRLPVSYLPWRY